MARRKKKVKTFYNPRTKTRMRYKIMPDGRARIIGKVGRKKKRRR